MSTRLRLDTWVPSLDGTGDEGIEGDGANWTGSGGEGR